jgi:hypothetical protein
MHFVGLLKTYFVEKMDGMESFKINVIRQSFKEAAMLRLLSMETITHITLNCLLLYYSNFAIQFPCNLLAILCAYSAQLIKYLWERKIVPRTSLEGLQHTQCMLNLFL